MTQPIGYALEAAGFTAPTTPGLSNEEMDADERYLYGQCLAVMAEESREGDLKIVVDEIQTARKAFEKDATKKIHFWTRGPTPYIEIDASLCRNGFDHYGRKLMFLTQDADVVVYGDKVVKNRYDMVTKCPEFEALL